MIVKNNVARRIVVTKSIAGRLSLAWTGENYVQPILLQVRKAEGQSNFVQTVQA